MVRRLSHWGWGYEDEQPSAGEMASTARGVASTLGFELPGIEEPVPLERVHLPAPGLGPPESLRRICSTSAHERASHTYGKSYADIVRGFRGRFDNPPDVVARPAGERDIEALLEWCESADAVVVPFGGGTNVVGGVEVPPPDRRGGVVAVDLRALDGVLECDPASRAARIQGGATGPTLERQLAGHGMTLRHFPQSFQFSTLGGWVATRAGGHYATLHTHIDDLVESVRAVTPRGTWESRRLPGSGAGVSPDRMLLGSEGTLGLITEAWLRLAERPSHRRRAAVRFPSFAAGAQAVHAIAQAGLYPANCRLLDAAEAALTAGGDGRHALLVLGFESADHAMDAWMDRALDLAAAHGGGRDPEGNDTRDTRDTRRSRDGGNDRDQAGAWRDAFVRAPYLRNIQPAIGLLTETFETAITWERFERFDEHVRAATTAKAREVCGAGTVTCRLAYTYPDGPAPYYTVVAPARRGEELTQWTAIKSAASEAVIEAGGTITHHHAVGREHRPWYDRQRPEPFAAALRAAKAAVDPRGLLNPGVLVDPC